MSSLKLSETVEKGKHPEKFGLAESKAGPEREYILQVGNDKGSELCLICVVISLSVRMLK